MQTERTRKTPVKKFHFITTVCALFVYLALSSCTEKQTFAREDPLNDFFNKKSVTIAVTDSGLGGLSILAESLEKIKEQKLFSFVQFVFFNSLFSEEGGYNSLKTQKEKVLIFDSALKGLEEYCSPDLILIGCNTLSVLYDKTDFSRHTQIPVKGIIDSGIDLIAEKLKSRPQAQVILFATQTTVEEGTHKKGLIESGFLEERIITQSCPELVQYIERGPSSEETEMLILAYTDEALQSLNHPDNPIFVSFNCTHYGYSLDLWKKAFQDLGRTPEAFLNPNSRMTQFLLKPERRGRFKNSTVAVRVVSMVKIGKEQMTSIGQWLAELSPQTAEALENYEHRENLFKWKQFIFSER